MTDKEQFKTISKISDKVLHFLNEWDMAISRIKEATHYMKLIKEV